MRYCPECGKEIPEGQEKCSLCSQRADHVSDNVRAHINLLTKRVNRDPSNIQLRKDLGDLYSKHGLTKEALDQYQEIIKIDPSDFHAQSNSASIYLRLKELDKAEKAFRAALHNNARSTEVLVGLFRTYYLQSKTDEAIALGNKLVALKPNNVEFHMLLKNLYAQKDNKEKVLAELLELEKLVSDNNEVIKEIAEIYRAADSFDKVIEYYCKMTERNIENTGLGFSIGIHYFNTGKYEDTIVHFSNMLKKNTISPAMEMRIQAFLAIAYYRKGDVADAHNILAEIQPSHAQYMDADLKKQLAYLFYTMGTKSLEDKDPREAKILFEKACHYDDEKLEYAQALENVRRETMVKYKSLLKKILMIAGSTAGLCLILIVIWIVTRNRIIIHVQPADNIVVLINGDSIQSIDEKTGTVRSPVYPIGNHDIIIDRTGYETWRGTASIGLARPAKLDVQLTPIYYSISLSSIPESASVVLDGKIIGTTPFTYHKVLACPHMLELERPGYAPWRTNLLLTEEDSIDLGIITLKNLAGRWLGEIGSSTFAFNASFNMTIEQTDTVLTIDYFHKPREECRYSGTIKGKVDKGTFYAEGKVTYKYHKVFYWAEERRRIIMQGAISNSWDRIEGTHTIESFAPEKWWAQHQQTIP